jgi:hypothetical protein
VSTLTQLHEESKTWAAHDGRHALGRTNFGKRLLNVPGVREGTFVKRAIGWNVQVLQEANGVVLRRVRRVRLFLLKLCRPVLGAQG